MSILDQDCFNLLRDERFYYLFDFLS